MTTPPPSQPSGANPSDPSGQDEALRALLAWYRAMGVDEITGPDPVGLRHLSARPPSPTGTGQEGKAQPGSKAAPLPKGRGLIEEASPDLVGTARGLAASAQSLDALRAALDGFEQCPLKARARNLVFADGAADADLMIVGEAPGQEEDRIGLPFVGRSGKLLDRMLEAIGRDRSTTRIANILPWRPPLNRKPELTEIQMCLPFLERHIELLAPKAVMALGGTAAQHLLGREDPMGRLRGQWHERTYGALQVPVIATYHPAYLLRTPIAKRMAWADLLTLKARLEETAG